MKYAVAPERPIPFSEEEKILFIQDQSENLRIEPTTLISEISTISIHGGKVTRKITATFTEAEDQYSKIKEVIRVKVAASSKNTTNETEPLVYTESQMRRAVLACVMMGDGLDKGEGQTFGERTDDIIEAAKTNDTVLNTLLSLKK